MNTINPENLPQIVWQNHKVITTELLAQCYDTDINNIQQNYSRNKDRFVEGKHFFRLEGEDLKSLRLTMSQSQNASDDDLRVSFSDSQNPDADLQISSKVRSLMLWTEKGAVRHAKILDTDKAWEVQERLEEVYFHPERNENDEEAKYFLKKYLAANKLYRVVKEHLDTQRLLISSLQSNLAFTQETVDKQVSKGLADMAEKLEAAEKAARHQVTVATQNEWKANQALSVAKMKLHDLEKEFDLLMRSTSPVGEDEARTILHWLYVQKMPTKDVANYFYRSVGQICKVRKERYTRWAKVMDYSWEHGLIDTTAEAEQGG